LKDITTQYGNISLFNLAAQYFSSKNNCSPLSVGERNLRKSNEKINHFQRGDEFNTNTFEHSSVISPSTFNIFKYTLLYDGLTKSISFQKSKIAKMLAPILY
jgi:hypothetical protein